MKYMNIDTGETYTREELEKELEMFKDEMRFDNFEDYLEEYLRLGRERITGFVEIED